MGDRKQGLMGTFMGLCKKLIPGSAPPSKKNVSTIYSKQSAVYSPEKQKSLETMCEKLFEQKELITTGKLQLLGLSKIKKKLGKTWVGLQPIVYTEVEEAIAKYMMPKDIFIRYKDDSYVIIFADAGPEESQIKATLIAEEIKRRLFEHEEEELNNVGVEESVAVFLTKDLKGKQNLSNTMDVIFEDKEDKKQSLTEKKPKIKIPSTIEIDPYADKQNPDEPKTETTEQFLNCTYVPLWDVKKNFLTTYLCLARGNQVEEDPFDCHEAFFRGTQPSVKIQQDLRVLKNVIKDLAEIIDSDRKLFIACPVHYETLTRAAGYEQYILECQKIPLEHKKYLVFLLLNFPDQPHKSNIQKFSIPLKTHCSSLFAAVPLNAQIDFSLIRECGFDAVGVRLKKATGSEKKVIETLGSFTQNAKKSFIKKVFALDVTSLSITTSAVCADIDYLGGPSIHESVDQPNNIYHFMHQDLFAKMLADQNS